MNAKGDWQSPEKAVGLVGLTVPKGLKWAQSDLNRRPPGYQPGAPANLSYGPRRQGKRPNVSLSGRIGLSDLSRQFDSLAERVLFARSSTAANLDKPTPSAPGQPGATFFHGPSGSPGPKLRAGTGETLQSRESNTDTRFGAPEKQEGPTVGAPAEGSAGIGSRRSDGGLATTVPLPESKEGRRLTLW
jgi:hypothetical protein